jgi:hypothetical protein
MNNAWSWFVILQVVLVIGGSALLLWRTSRKRAGDATQETTHVWDGDLREYDKPLPRWWINLFYLTIVFLIVYLIVYPGFGNLPGTQGWSSTRQHAADQAATQARLVATFRPGGADAGTLPVRQPLRHLSWFPGPRRSGLPEPHRRHLAMGRQLRGHTADRAPWPQRDHAPLG